MSTRGFSLCRIIFTILAHPSDYYYTKPKTKKKCV